MRLALSGGGTGGHVYPEPLGGRRSAFPASQRRHARDAVHRLRGRRRRGDCRPRGYPIQARLHRADPRPHALADGRERRADRARCPAGARPPRRLPPRRRPDDRRLRQLPGRTGGAQPRHPAGPLPAGPRAGMGRPRDRPPRPEGRGHRDRVAAAAPDRQDDRHRLPRARGVLARDAQRGPRSASA